MTVLHIRDLLQRSSVFSNSSGFSGIIGSAAVRSTGAEAKDGIMVVYDFFQKVEFKGLTLAHFSRVSLNSQGTKRPPKRQ